MRATPATSIRISTKAATASSIISTLRTTLTRWIARICGRPAEIVSEENYFFKLSAFQDRLLKLYEDQPDFIRPAFRKNEVVRFVEAGLRDISVSRKTVKWGLPWPEDPEHVVYVWYDALTSYLSGIGYGDDELQYEKYWPAQLHLIGKEIMRFHCVYWPAFLMAVDEKLPKAIFAHGWLLFDQQKMSKSKGNVAYPEPIARTVGVDALRYYLLREVPFGQDGNFSHDALLTRYNSDLANGLGNLASRTLAMIERYCGGEVPAAARRPLRATQENALAATVSEASRTAVEQYEELSFSRALEIIWAAIAQVDGYITARSPGRSPKSPISARCWRPFSTMRRKRSASSWRWRTRSCRTPHSRFGISLASREPWPKYESISLPGAVCSQVRPHRRSLGGISASRKI